MVVRSVLPNGASGRSGLIHEGDAILSLDGVDMRGKVRFYIDMWLFFCLFFGAGEHGLTFVYALHGMRRAFRNSKRWRLDRLEA
jgi:hypothetical protein